MRAPVIGVLAILVLPWLAAAQTPEAVPLWPDGAPGFEDRRDEPEAVTERVEPDLVFPVTSNIHNPSITPYLPAEDAATGAAVIVAPGGGHRFLTMDREGYDVGRFLAEHGIAAFVLKYRLGRQPGSPYSIEEHARLDGQRAVRLVRSRAEEWHVDPDRIGMLGFSAGGEVLFLTSFSDGSPDPEAIDPVERYGATPSFIAPIYAGPLGLPSEIAGEAPPAFCVAAFDDRWAGTLIGLAEQYRQIGVPLELHLYSTGGHVFGIRQDRPLAVTAWPTRLLEWMKDQALLQQSD